MHQRSFADNADFLPTMPRAWAAIAAPERTHNAGEVASGNCGHSGKLFSVGRIPKESKEKPSHKIDTRTETVRWITWSAVDTERLEGNIFLTLFEPKLFNCDKVEC